MAIKGVHQAKKASLKEKILMEYQMREMELECQPSVDMGTSTNDFFDPYDYYPLQYSNENMEQ